MNRDASPCRFRFTRPPDRFAPVTLGMVLLLCAAHLTVIPGCSDRPPLKHPPTPQQEPEDRSEAAGGKISSVFSQLGSVEDKTTQPGSAGVATTVNPLVFSDVSDRVGLEFHYVNGAIGRNLMVEATGGGCGWIDFDHDGFMDIGFPQGGDPTRSGSPDQPSDKLFRNSGGQSFRDVTQEAGLEDHRYGQGIAVADFDNDGFDDIFVTNVGVNQLYRNQGDGTFREVPTSAGFGESAWSSSAAWGDVDRDGDLDLYVCNYCEYDPQNPVRCIDDEGQPAICHPKEVAPSPDEFYRNLGDGTFEPCARSLGLFGEENRGLGVVIADLNNDRWPDIYVANDTTANFLFRNDGGQRFQEMAALMGCAVNVQGMGQASMGIGCGDYDGNGLLDLYLTHFTNEWNTLYTNLGEKGFYDTTAVAGLVVPTMNRLAFGTVMNDLNQDQKMELFVANGHIHPKETGGVTYRMTPQLFSWNGRTWDDAGSSAGEYFHQRVVGRGVATADYDNDGKLDLCVVHHDCPAVLLRNECAEGTWLQIQLAGTQSPRSAIGTRVHVTADGVTQMQELMGGTSYCSAMQLQLNFGFAKPAATCSLLIEWTSGETSVLEDVPLNQPILIVEPFRQTQPATWVLSNGRKN